MKLQILIPTLEARRPMLDKLHEELSCQIVKHKLEKEVGISIFSDAGELHIGKKRNTLIEKSEAEYVCFLDDDDWVDENYVYIQHWGCTKGNDCVELRGIYTQNGHNPTPFIHSLKYDRYFGKGGTYYRPPNHLNAIKRELILPFKFPEISFGEDTDWAMRVCNAKILKSETSVQKPIYHYRYVVKPNRLS
jgi:glycosyltransferase involved in cell wall biosynthesis